MTAAAIVELKTDVAQVRVLKGRVSTLSSDADVTLPASFVSTLCADVLAYADVVEDRASYRAHVDRVLGSVGDEEWSGGAP